MHAISNILQGMKHTSVLTGVGDRGTDIMEDWKPGVNVDVGIEG